MPVERVEANPKVKADEGHVAIQRGPIVYGIEGVDNGGRTDITLPADPRFEVEQRPEMLGGVAVVKGVDAEGKAFVAIPFYAMANREKSRQVVWLRQAEKVDGGAWGDELYRTYEATR
jgi:DUF1680 family protein